MKEDKIRPTRNLLLCRVQEKPNLTKSGLHIPETVAGREDRAEVLAVGEGWYTAKGILVACCVKPGDLIIFDPRRVEWVENVAQDVQAKYARPGNLFMIHDDAALAVVE